MLSAHQIRLLSGLISLSLIAFGARPHQEEELQTEAHSTTPRQSSLPGLEPGQAITREPPGSEGHSYRVRLQEGEFLQVRIDQKGIDIGVRLFDGGGKQLSEMNGPNGREGFEVLSWIAEKPGEYLIVISATTGDATTGEYTISRQGIGRATEQARRRVEIERLFMDAMAALNSRDVAEREMALPKLESALSGWEELQDGYMAGLTDSELKRLKEPAPLPSKGEAKMFSSAHNINGRSIKTPMKYGERISFPVYLQSGESLLLDLEEHDVNAFLLVARMKSATKGVVVAQSHYSQGYGHETLTFIAERDEEYLIAVETEPEFSVGEAAWVRLTPFVRKTTSSNDRQRAAAERLMFDAYLLETRADSIKGKRSAATKLAEAALLWRNAGDIYWEGHVYAQLGDYYSDLHETDKALASYTQALRLLNTTGSKSGEAWVRRGLATLYSYLGDSTQELDNLQKAVALWNETGSKKGEAAALSNVCEFSRIFDTGEQRLDCYLRALALYREVDDIGGEAMMLNNIGLYHQENHQYKKAIRHLELAAAASKKHMNLDMNAIIQANLAYAHADRGDKGKALASTLPVLESMMEHGDEFEVASTYAGLSGVWHSLNNPSLAIFYGKQAINGYQGFRGDILQIDKQLQRMFLKRIETSYRRLAEQLIGQQRLEEAQQVIELFKDQQFFDFRNDEGQNESRPVKKLGLTEAEQTAARFLEQTHEELRTVGKQYHDLRAATDVETKQTRAMPEQKARLAQLEQRIRAARDEHRRVHGKIEKLFSSVDPENNRLRDMADVQMLRKALRDISVQTGQKAVAIYTLVGHDRLHALLVTPEKLSVASQPVGAEMLDKKALQLWALLQSNTYDPTSLAQELYAMIFKPIERDIPPDTETLLWSLDGNLRYLPMGVLHDGRDYLIRRYNNVVFTRLERERLMRSSNPHWTGVGFGSSRAHTVELQGSRMNFSALPGVDVELGTIFHTGGAQGDLVDGEVLADDRFTRAAMLAALRQRRPLVHIASHFSFRPGDEERSFLLLGDGSVMTLKEMKAQKELFASVELLTLSACNTAAQQTDANGREIDGFAELAQRLGATSVMATLWPVADNSSPWLMGEFYQARRGAQGVSKAEALRRAQLALLDGTANVQPLPRAYKDSSPSVRIVIRRAGGKRQEGEGRGVSIEVDTEDAAPFQQNGNRPFAHPHFWAPFILIGNWK